MEALSRRHGRRDLGRCDGERHLRRAFPLPDGNPCWPMWIGDRIYFLPITKASGTSIRARTTAATYAATPTRASITLAFRPPTASASSTPPAAAISLYDIAADAVSPSRSRYALDRAANGAPFRKCCRIARRTSRRTPTERSSPLFRAGSRLRCPFSKAR